MINILHSFGYGMVMFLFALTMFCSNPKNKGKHDFAMSFLVSLFLATAMFFVTL